MTRVKATLLSAKLFARIVDREVKAEIHSRFKNAINIELEDGYLFNILPEIIPPNSRSLVLPLREWHLIQGHVPTHGMAILIRESQLEIPALAVKITYRPSKLWDPTPSLPGPPITSSQIRRNLEMVLGIIVPSAETENFTKGLMTKPHQILERIPHKAICEAHHHRFLEIACAAVHDLLVSLSNLDFRGVTEASSRLIGLGPGLTPSGDDILAGLMAAGVFLGLAYEDLRLTAKGINSSILHGHLASTTTHSQILLSDAGRGEVVRPLGQLLQGILCGENVVSIPSLTRQVMVLGESSGKDTLAGIIIGTEAFLRLRARLRRNLP